MFICNKNKFLASIINSKKIKEVHFEYNYKGIITYRSNIEILKLFFETATKSQLIQAQQLLKQQNFTEKAINEFAYLYGEQFILKKI